MDSNDINKLFRILSMSNPNPKIELNYVNGFTLTVAVLLSAQSTDINVNKVTDNLFVYLTLPQDYVNLGYHALKEKIKTIGLFNKKAHYIIELSEKLIVDNYKDIPNDFDYLIELPGIGRKSANVILNALYSEPLIGVDTHVFRVSNRLGIVKEKNILKVENKLLEIIPLYWKKNAHNWLVLHGRYICKAVKPLCKQCVVKTICSFYKNKYYGL